MRTVGVVVSVAVAIACGATPSEHRVSLEVSPNRDRTVFVVHTLPGARVRFNGSDQGSANQSGSVRIEVEADQLTPSVEIVSELEGGSPPNVTLRRDVWGRDDVGIVAAPFVDPSARASLQPTGTWGVQEAQTTFDAQRLTATVVLRALADTTIENNARALSGEGTDRTLEIGCEQVLSAFRSNSAELWADLRVPLRIGTSARTLVLRLDRRHALDAIVSLGRGRPLCVGDDAAPSARDRRRNTVVVTPGGATPDAAVHTHAVGLDANASFADVDAFVFVTPGAVLHEQRCGPYGRYGQGNQYFTRRAQQAVARVVDPRSGETLQEHAVGMRNNPFVLDCPHLWDPQFEREVELPSVDEWVRREVLRE
jgi:hypothetical protein